MLTNKEIAQRLRELDESGNWGGVQDLADELDPPLPEPGTVVWWAHANDTGRQYIGYAVHDGVASLHHPESVRDHYVAKWDRIEWWPARILEPGQVAVDREELRNLIQHLRIQSWHGWVDYLQAAYNRDTEVDR